MGLLQENGGDDTYSIFLQNAETVALITPEKGKPIWTTFEDRTVSFELQL
jgi:3-dehydroquinate synthase class II